MKTMSDHVPPRESAVDRVRRDPRLRSRDDSGVAALAIGTLAWCVALVVLAVLGDRLSGVDVARWMWICAAGALLGIPGIAIAVVRQRRRAGARSGQE